jgi:predicted MPP superfamily phosphohydrolase
LSLGGIATVNWGFLLLRIAIGLGVLALLYLSQRFWYRSLWRVSAHWGRSSTRVVLRFGYVVLLCSMIVNLARGVLFGRNGFSHQNSSIAVITGLWFFSALFAYLSVKAVHGLELIWRWSHHNLAKPSAAPSPSTAPAAAPEAAETVPDPGRRYFFRAATAAAGAAPFLTAMYGFAAERLKYQVRHVEIPIPNLPHALDGMKIVQLSDIHLSSYMTRTQVRRAVDMANDLGADLAVVTGDLITGSGDSIADCIEEVRRLHAPLGVWGCNGNHEIYARAEDEAAYLYAQAGMKLLRQQNAQLAFKGARFNLIGVDYQREYSPRGQRQRLLAGIEPMVRRDMPNILLSHNPNSFNRAAEMGIELSLAGHTHGGQIQVEILDHRLSPARFISDYIAGLYQRPLFAPAPNERAAGTSHSRKSFPSLALAPSAPLASIYVNRGLGTVGAPVRLGVPPEISLIVLRRAA